MDVPLPNIAVATCLLFFCKLWLYEHQEYCELCPCLYRAIRDVNRKTWVSCFDNLRRRSARDNASNCMREYPDLTLAKLVNDAYTHHSIHRGSNLK